MICRHEIYPRVELFQVPSFMAFMLSLIIASRLLRDRS
jgi:hypothetical protein